MKEKSYLIYGIHPVYEAVTSGQSLERVYIQNNLRGNLSRQLIGELKNRNIPFSTVPLEKLKRLTSKVHQGVVGFSSPIQYYAIESLLPTFFEEGKSPIVLVLDGITDVRNFGSIARTAVCLKIDSIIIPVKYGAQVSPDAMKTSSGAFNYIPICRTSDMEASLQFLQHSGLQIVACSEKAQTSIHTVDLTIPTAFIMGSEDKGVQDKLLKKANKVCKIPMEGNINSLNVSVATGMVAYEAQRQRINEEGH